MKLYTKRGDAGQTDLFGGQRIDKDAPRIEAIGAVDELNSFIGLAGAACADRQLIDLLHAVQCRLFEIGADLSSPGSDSAAIPRIAAEHVTEAEKQIDAACAGVAPMKHFILPGGSEPTARLHVARAACRRAERLCIALDRAEPVNPSIVVYLNRLSDLLFALARLSNHRAGVPDLPWIATTQQARG